MVQPQILDGLRGHWKRESRNINAFPNSFLCDRMCKLENRLAVAACALFLKHKDTFQHKFPKIVSDSIKEFKLPKTYTKRKVIIALANGIPWTFHLYGMNYSPFS